jgi:hypothetical protein
MGLATVRTSVHDLAEPVVFAQRRYTSGCTLDIRGVAPIDEGAELRSLVPELDVFPDVNSWSVPLRRTLVPLDEHDVAPLKRQLIPILQPLERHLDN